MPAFVGRTYRLIGPDFWKSRRNIHTRSRYNDRAFNGKQQASVSSASVKRDQIMLGAVKVWGTDDVSRLTNSEATAAAKG